MTGPLPPVGSGDTLQRLAAYPAAACGAAGDKGVKLQTRVPRSFEEDAVISRGATLTGRCYTGPPNCSWASRTRPEGGGSNPRAPRKEVRRPGAEMIGLLAFSITLLLGGLFSPGAVEAQQAAKVARIGVLANNTAANPHLLEAFLQGLRDLGYVEGRNLVIEYRLAEGRVERYPALAAELVALKVDVILAANLTAALAAKQATRTLPIVFAAEAADSVASGLVTSLARPGGNVTGLTGLSPALVGKCLDQLKQAVPNVSRIAVLWQPGAAGERTEKDMLKGAEVTSRALGVRLQFVEARASKDLDRAFLETTRARANALTVLSTAMFSSERRRLVDLAAQNRLPTVFSQREYVDAGGLMSYGPNLTDLYLRAASYVVKILKGAKPADLHVEQPTKFELIINLKAAKALGLTIPPSLLARADHVIEK